jgi:threonine synthase
MLIILFEVLNKKIEKVYFLPGSTNRLTMHEKYLQCFNCGAKYTVDEIIFRCNECHGSLEVVFDYPSLRKLISVKKLRSRPFNHARYFELYPVDRPLSIQEGGTPLIRSRNLETELKLGFDLWFKYEAQNPTGSFKDRGSSVEVARALDIINNRHNPFKGVACASTGNMGASVAAYSAMANLKCTILTPRNAPETKVEQILAYGARVYKISGDYTKAARIVEEAFLNHGVYLLGDYLYRREGTKSVGFEIADQLGDEFSFKAPDYLISPIGNGTLLSALWKAFKELEQLRLLRELPAMAGTQAIGCSPVSRAFTVYKKGKKAQIKPVKGKTIATAIDCGDPLDGPRTFAALQESRGFANEVSDRDILRARELLARREGLFVEPAGAAAFAGLIKAAKQKKIPKGSRVVCLLTGHGLKNPSTAVKGKVIKTGANPDLSRIF